MVDALDAVTGNRQLPAVVPPPKSVVDWTDSTATLASGRVVDRVVVAGWDGRIALVGRGAGGPVEVLSSIRFDELLPTPV
ncbi:hypothetical protein [Streptomyces acidiscabies]|uniref:hypothetical protein n=1 Tax=Streptomyces acidiscabies TaxID=42234 RepID=UPI00117D1387|nr:hypothetical protein [Streptomyces acidiscabies]